MQKIRLAAPLQTDSIVDGPGIRAVIWTQGCKHHCKGCHNQETWDFEGGSLYSVDEVKKQMRALENHDGITLSGGDPFFQPEACYELAKYAKKLGLNIWCYTGFDFEVLVRRSKNDQGILNLLNNIDVLVDGKFDISKKSFDALFRGSYNQKIIDVPKSLKENKISLVEKFYKEEKKYNPLQRKNMYI